MFKRRGWIKAILLTALLQTSTLCLLPSSIRASENDFYRGLQRKPSATNEDVVRAVARLRGYRGDEEWQRESQYLVAQGVKFRRNMLKTPHAPATKGDAANLFLNAMDNAAGDRGLFGRLFPRSRRFAARDGMAQKLLPDDSYMNEFISGAELLAMLGRASEQMEKVK